MMLVKGTHARGGNGQGCRSKRSGQAETRAFSSHGRSLVPTIMRVATAAAAGNGLGLERGHDDGCSYT